MSCDCVCVRCGKLGNCGVLLKNSNTMKLNYVRLLAVAVLANLLSFTAYGQENSLKGRVVDEESNGIAKATVQLLNEPFGTVTDDQGNFSLTVNSSNPVVVIRAVGFATRQDRAAMSAEGSIE